MRNSGVLAIILLSALLWKCASQTTPTGGPKDETPPMLLKSTPTHKQKNFSGKTVELVFDEFVNLNNPKEEILISPSLAKDVEYKVRKNIGTITSPNGWQDSTTYSISFREGIRDITENNPPENLKLAFSTGPSIDSMLIAGQVVNALKETIPEKITVALFKADTFNIFEHQPDYFTVIDKKGKFSLENIQSGNYFLYAFDDKNKNLKVESRSEKYGYKEKSITLDGPKDSVTISLINLDARALKLITTRNNGLSTRIKFNKYITNYTVTDSVHSLINSFGDDQTEIFFYTPKKIQDSLKISVFAIDSVEQRIDTAFYIKSMEPNSIPSDFTVNSEKLKYDPSSGEISQTYKLTKPLKSITYDSIFIQADSSYYIHLTPDDFSYDSTYKRLYFKKVLPQDTLFRSKNFKTQLITGKASFISFENDSSKSQKQVITKIQKDQTGTLLLETQTEESYYIVQLLTTNGALVKEIRNTKKMTLSYLPAQNYKIRVIVDTNNNGKWDAGNVLKWIEPERVYFYQTADKSFTFPIRANWELGPLMLIF